MHHPMKIRFGLSRRNSSNKSLQSPSSGLTSPKGKPRASSGTADDTTKESTFALLQRRSRTYKRSDFSRILHQNQEKLMKMKTQASKKNPSDRFHYTQRLRNMQKFPERNTDATISFDPGVAHTIKPQSPQTLVSFKKPLPVDVAKNRCSTNQGEGEPNTLNSFFAFGVHEAQAALRSALASPLVEDERAQIVFLLLIKVGCTCFQSSILALASILTLFCGLAVLSEAYFPLIKALHPRYTEKLTRNRGLALQILTLLLPLGSSWATVFSLASLALQTRIQIEQKQSFQSATQALTLQLLFTILQESGNFLALLIQLSGLALIYFNLERVLNKFVQDENEHRALKEELAAVKQEVKSLMLCLPKGLILYSVDKDAGSSISDIKVKFMNEEFSRTIFGQRALSVHPKLLHAQFRKPSFKQVNFSTSGKQKVLKVKKKLSLFDIITQGDPEPVSYFQYEIVNEQNLDGLQSPASVAPSTYSGIMAAQGRQIMNLEIMIQKIQFEGAPSFLLSLQNINSILENENNRLQAHYQEAITATISHEQMNPLNSIINLSTQMQRTSANLLQIEGLNADIESTLSDEEIQFDKQIRMKESDLKQFYRSLNMVRCSSGMIQLLNMAMLNSTLIKQQTFRPEFSQVFDPVETVQEFTSLFAPELKSKNITLIISDIVGGDLQSLSKLEAKGISLDKELYRQILFNIFINACKYSKRNGKIKVCVSIAKYLDEQASPNSDLPRLLLSTEIEDDGIGMSKSQQKKLFKLFETTKQQAWKSEVGIGSSMNYSSHGQGLGLYLSMQLAQFMEGDIKIKSEPGNGTRVTVSLCVDLAVQRIETPNLFSPSTPIKDLALAHRVSDDFKFPAAQRKASSSFKQAARPLFQNQQATGLPMKQLNLQVPAKKFTSEYANLVSLSQQSHRGRKLSICLVNKRRSIEEENAQAEGMEEEKQLLTSNSSTSSIEKGRRSSSSSSSSLISEPLSDSESSFSEATEMSQQISIIKRRMPPKEQSRQTTQSDRLLFTVESDGEESLFCQPGLHQQVDLYNLNVRSKQYLDHHQNNPQEESSSSLSSGGGLSSVASSVKAGEGSPLVVNPKQFRMNQEEMQRMRRRSAFQPPAFAQNSLLEIQGNSSSCSSSSGYQSHQPPQQTNSLEEIKEDFDEDMTTLNHHKRTFGDSSFTTFLATVQKRKSFLEPKTTEATAGVPVTSPNARQQGCRCKSSPILIVDDSLFNLETLKLIIRDQFKTTPDTAVDGSFALDLFKQRAKKINSPTCPNRNCPLQPYSLIFMDINMPVMDGIESAEQILKYQASAPQKQPCEIVILTAFTNQENIQKARSLGIKHILHKPAKAEQVQELIRANCPGVKAAS